MASADWSTATEPTAVYRLYNEADALLYIGITNSLERRAVQHAAEKVWWGDVAYWTVDWHPDRGRAERAELEAIRTDMPAYNRAGIDEAPRAGRDPVRRWIKLAEGERGFSGRLALLNALFTTMVQVRSLPSAARTAWRLEEITQAYRHMYGMAGRVLRRAHHRYVDHWNRDTIARQALREDNWRRLEEYQQQREANSTGGRSRKRRSRAK